MPWTGTDLGLLGRTAGGEFECNTLESFPNHPPKPQSMEKLSSMKLVPGAKKVEYHYFMALHLF